MNNIKNCLKGYANPTVVALVSDGSAYTDDDGNYILADSDIGVLLLSDADTYTTITLEGNYYRMVGADTVFPFKRGIENILTLIVDSLSSYTSTEKQKLLIVGTAEGRKGDGVQIPSISYSKNGVTIDSLEISVPRDVFQWGGVTIYIYIITRIAIVDVESEDVITATVSSATYSKVCLYSLE